MPAGVAVRAALLSFALASTVAATEDPIRKVPDFALKDTGGKTWSLGALKDRKAVVVVFLGTQCPINNAFLPRLAELHRTFAPQGVQFLAINANSQDSAADIAQHARRYKIPFPVLRDEGNVVADQLGARRTPEALVLDAARTVRYQGRIDDQFGLGYQRPAPTRQDLAEALREVLTGKAVSVPTTPVAGCIIGRVGRPRAGATVTYSRDVAPILQRKCQGCHRPGQVGPFALLSYDDAHSWAATIREVVEDRRMPPWHADPRFGKFANDRSLSEAERKTLLAWIDQGCARGPVLDLPPPRQFAEGWGIGKPDVVLTMPQAFSVPARAPTKGVRYQYFVVPTNFDKDVWVQAAEARPGARAVVHHIIVYVFEKGQKRKRGPDGIGSGFLVAYAPGDLGVAFAPGAAKKIPRGAVLVFQMHYTPNGVAQEDRSSVGLVIAKAPPRHEVRTRAIAQQVFLIPPKVPDYKVTSATTFRQDTLLWSLLPHMHLRGKSFEYRAVYPDGKRQTLLSVPRYDFGWQSTYRLAEPLRLPAGTRIECTAHFDNSAANPNNPDPSRFVYWGDQTWEEMMIGFVDYTTLPSR
jgi:peroxiredoxin